MNYTAQYLDFGLIEYKEAWNRQEVLNQQIRDHKDAQTNEPGKLIFCEHPHVFTMGKSGQQNNLLINDEFLKRIDASYYQSNRGGDITYHGPGQIVGYPIFDLEALNMGVKEYIHKLEQAIINTLAQYSIVATQLEGATGVWLETATPRVRKICAIGVKISKAVTMHGFALNVNTNLNYFSYINPCGFIDKGVTSMEKEIGKKPDFEEVKQRLKEEIVKVFHLSMQN
ncbi:MAG: lipoyl(octanoyl) transferase LipB [Bacteroidota bacterium]|nr:MAG: lipoyl(octanoyl) transferase LipB [Bacteroidota bacterium]